jgi:type VII secretion integral membrane protein EccD
MPDPVCRLAIQHGPRTVDLALPGDAPVGLLMPSIVDLVDQGTVAANEGRQWHLSRVGQAWLDETMSLHDNAIRDGELLLLTTTAMPAPVWIEDDPWHAVIGTADTGRAPTRVTATGACLCTAVLDATALVWSGVVTHAIGHVITAGAIAAATAIGAVVVRRADRDPNLCVTLSIIAVVFAAVAGFLAVPAGPSTANSLLAAAVACSMSILLLRLTRCGAICLTAAAALTALTSVVSACGVAWTLNVAATGAALSTLSLAALGMAARLSIAAAGLAPAMPSPDHRGEEDPAKATPQAITAHHWLTGLVIGSACAAALGEVMVASSCIRDGRFSPNAAVFAAVVGVVMVLRARTHIDVRRRTALNIGGLVAMAAGAGLVVVSAPGQANWVCVLATAIALAMLVAAPGPPPNPLARRAVEVLEYLALAAVVPLACWVGGLYGLVRGLSLP